MNENGPKLSGRPAEVPFESGATAVPVVPDHELIRRIGSGSYGEVWLARSALGHYRAVKIVRRNSFPTERPFEREFEGIKKFEPVSRLHESQVDILHVGRGMDCFYYVMELADSAEGREGPGPQTPEPVEGGESAAAEFCLETYQPRTLKRELQKRGALPLEECIEIAVSLATALDHLHAHGLVHRDIKPSNIIFVDGVPKLADIGLVTDVDATKSFVGTEGYIPPEGAGTPAADIFSLGKVLYEISTGKDRQEFPEPPTAWGVHPDEKALLEFQEVLLKACEPELKRRYQSAHEMRADLVLLQSGKSVLRLHRLERRSAIATKVGLVAVLVALVALAAYFGSIKQVRRARLAERRASENLNLLRLQQAEELFQNDEGNSALTYLARVLRDQPTDRVAAGRLLSALTWRPFAIPLMEPIGPAGQRYSAAFSPDDQYVLIASQREDGDAGGQSVLVQVFELSSGRLVSPDLHHEGRVGLPDFSPDGQKVVTVVGTNVVLVDWRTGRVTTSMPHKRAIASAHFSPDGRWLVTASRDAKAYVWNAETGERISGPMAHRAEIRYVVMSPDGTRVATASRDRTVGLWDARTGIPICPPLPHGNWVDKAHFSPDGKLLLSVSDEPVARVWDAFTGQLVASLPHRKVVRKAAFSPGSDKVITTSEDNTAVLWDAHTGEPLGQPMRHQGWIVYAKFSPDGLRLVTASDDNTVRLWDAATGAPLSEPLRHPRDVLSVSFSHDGQRILCAAHGDGVWIWDALVHHGLAFPVPDSTLVRQLAFSADGRWAAGCGAGREVQIWEVNAGWQPVRTLVQDAPVSLVRFCPDGQRLVAVGTNQVAWIWETKTGSLLSTNIRHDGPILSATFSPDGRQLLTTSSDDTACVWDAVSGRLRCGPLRHQGEVGMGCFSPDGRLLATGSFDRTAEIWETETGQLRYTLPHRHSVVCLEFSRDGKWLATGSSDRNARVWETGTGHLIGAPMPHDNDVTSVHFSPDGRFLLTASLDRTARLWDPRSGRQLTVPLRHASAVSAAIFSPDSLFVATQSDDGTARLWDAARGLPISERFTNTLEATSALLSPDGRWLVTGDPDHGVQVRTLWSPPEVAPGWLCDLAEAIAGERLNEHGVSMPVAISEVLAVKARLRKESNAGGGDGYGAWANWFFAEERTRPISPGSPISAADFVQRSLEVKSWPMLRDAVGLVPTNARVLASLAGLALTQNVTHHPHRVAEAEALSRRALELAPSDDVVAQARKEIQQALDKSAP